MEYQTINKSELNQCLWDWYENTDEETIGDIGNYGGSVLLRIIAGLSSYNLNADTKREGVKEYLDLLNDNQNLEWSIVLNQKGNLNKVAFGEEDAIIEGFYLYKN
jgi:hypothetical protein